MKRRPVTYGAAVMLGDEPPTEFRVLRRGENTTSKGPILFDAKAARSLMAAYEATGRDVMIDLEHLSLDSDVGADRDARGWCRLELRTGELWAVDVQWTPDGEARLREKRQRYVSPAFLEDADGRPIELVNIALTALPATHHAMPLVAASEKEMEDTDKTEEERRSRKLAKLRKLMDLPEDASAEDVVAALDQMPAAQILDVALAAVEEAVVAAEEEGGSETDVPDATADDEEIAAAARSMTGATSPAAVKAALKAMRQGGDAAKLLARDVELLKREAAERERDDLIKMHADQIPPALEKWAAEQSPEALRAYLAHAPRGVRTATPPAPAPQISQYARDVIARRVRATKCDAKEMTSAFVDMRAAMRRGQEQ